MKSEGIKKTTFFIWLIIVVASILFIFYFAATLFSTKKSVNIRISHEYDLSNLIVQVNNLQHRIEELEKIFSRFSPLLIGVIGETKKSQ